MDEQNSSAPHTPSPRLQRIPLRKSRGIDPNLRPFSPLRALTTFTHRFPQIMELFQEVGIHPVKPKVPLNPYTGEPSKESFRNIGEHCLAVAHAASKVGSALAETGVIGAEELDLIVERALVHDITKPYEIMRRNAKNAGLVTEVYSTSAYQQLQPLLEQIGISSELAEYLVDAGSETGHNSLKDFLAVEDGAVTGLISGHLPEKIVHLADDMTYTSTPMFRGEKVVTVFLPPWERMLAARFMEKYPSWMWTEGLAITPGGTIVQVPDVHAPPSDVTVIGHYAALQVEVSGAISHEFQLMLDPKSTQEPEQFIKDLINDSPSLIISDSI
ncbi:hypothetical protein MRY87_01660 [bacterium]|nr:hypothetical protein [bacterium]